MNLTLSMDAQLLNDARAVAFERDQSLTEMIRSYLKDVVNGWHLGRKAKAQQLMDAGKDTGDGEELHVEQWMPYEGIQDSRFKIQNSITSNEALTSLQAYMQKHNMDVLHSSTQIIIAPGYQFHIVQMMVTNFHQPQSTLLLLVSAFVHGNWRKIYDYALANGFRFLSYGDSSLLIP